MLDSAAQDAELAVENVRARRRARSKRHEGEDEDEYTTNSYRDPGYSQAVRRACQHRLVQLIPVRRGTVAFVLSAFWCGFAGLLLAHYFLFTSNPEPAHGSIATLPLGHLFHLRSPHGIAHWLTCQLWLLTGIVCWMNFNLRRHKLDDYRARYRIWVFVAIAAFFSSFDASTSVLQLVGMSIDSWARAEIGYGGWPLVLASFASLIGVLGIRLSSELKTVISSVVSWIVGLLAWAGAALLGTGLLKVQIPAPQLDLLVGALWLGGVLAVFQAVSMYLRATYIQAQKRFLQRSGCELGRIQFQLPSLKNRFRRRQEEEGQDTSERTSSSRKRKKEVEPTEEETRSGRKLFGLIPDRHLRNESLEFEPFAEDDGGELDRGLTKKPGWFGIGGNKGLEPKERTTQPKKIFEPRERDEDREGEVGREDEGKATAKRWGMRMPKIPSLPKLPKLPARKPKEKSASSERGKETGDKPVTEKRSMFGLRKKPTDGQAKGSEPKADKNQSRSEKLKGETKEKKGWLNMFDGLKLKPPTDQTEKVSTEKKKEAPKQASSTERIGSAPATVPIPIKSGSQVPSTTSYDDDEDYDTRPLSKAERKRLRRQQDDRRAA